MAGDAEIGASAGRAAPEPLRVVPLFETLADLQARGRGVRGQRALCPPLFPRSP